MSNRVLPFHPRRDGAPAFRPLPVDLGRANGHAFAPGHFPDDVVPASHRPFHLPPQDLRQGTPHPVRWAIALAVLIVASWGAALLWLLGVGF